jgi:ornithine carbamoyltransferase
MMKHLLKLQDLTPDELTGILNLADQLKYEKKHNIAHEHLKGQTLGMIFTKSSTRTRVSFEVGMYQLGGTALFLSDKDIQLGRGEPIKDTARVLSRMLDGIMIRTFAQQDVEDLATYGSIPIINGLTDYCHPCQVLADLLTVREHKGGFDGLKACYIGDGNNMANSLVVGCLLSGMSFSLATPEAYKPCKHIMDFGASYGNKFSWSTDIFEAAEKADVIFTDVWASMGQEGEAEIRRKAFAGYCVDKKLLGVANSGCMLQHCLPAHKGEEIAEDVFEEHANEIFDEAENRLHAQKAVMWLCMHKN